MLRSIGYPSDNHSGRKWVDSGHNKRRTCDHSVSTSAFEHSFISCLWTCEEAHCCLPILEQPLPSMHNLILHWFVTLASVESSEVRVCSYSLSDVMPMAIVLSVPEPTHVIQPYCHDTVLAITDPEPKRSVNANRLITCTENMRSNE